MVDLPLLCQGRSLPAFILFVLTLGRFPETAASQRAPPDGDGDSPVSIFSLEQTHRFDCDLKFRTPISLRDLKRSSDALFREDVI